MPVDRTPPPAGSAPASEFTLLRQTEHYSSTPELSIQQQTAESAEHHVTLRRTKRKLSESGCESQLTSFMTEMRKMFLDFKTEQDKRMDMLCNTVEDIKNQNNDIRNSLDFLSGAYDSLKKQIDTLDQERQQDLRLIDSLQEKIDKFEQSHRSTCLEIRNLPPSKQESKDSLLKIVRDTLQVIGLDVLAQDVKDVFRIATREPGNKTIIVDFTSVLTREKVIEKFKKYNKEHSRLSTETLKMSGTPKPIFISENLSPKLKRLFFLARDFAKNNNFKYCWVSHGKIFLRQSDGSTLIIIRSEKDLTHLSQQK
jgi:chromosome segregation ATPase